VEVKIVEFDPSNKGKAERKLADLLSQGWRIVTGGGSGARSGFIIVLQRDTPHSPKEKEKHEYYT
jgi:hypothetical protein